MSLNRVSLIGHVGKTPRFYQTEEGDAYAFFSLALRNPGKIPQGKNKPTHSGILWWCFHKG